jgi:hypothetical protein
MKVALCFSAANIKIVKTNCAVRNISINNPCTTLVSPPSVVCTFKAPGNMHSTSALATMPPRIWLRKSRTPRNQGSAPMRHMPKVTAGLNNPPEMRKKTQAVTAREKPNERAMYCSCCALEPSSATVRPAEEGTVLATWAPLRARRRKRDLPTNSPVVAWAMLECDDVERNYLGLTMKWFLIFSGILLRNGMRMAASSSREEMSGLLVACFVKKGRAKLRLLCGDWVGGIVSMVLLGLLRGWILALAGHDGLDAHVDVQLEGCCALHDGSCRRE